MPPSDRALEISTIACIVCFDSRERGLWGAKPSSWEAVTQQPPHSSCLWSLGPEISPVPCPKDRFFSCGPMPTSDRGPSVPTQKRIETSPAKPHATASCMSSLPWQGPKESRGRAFVLAELVNVVPLSSRAEPALCYEGKR